MTSIDLQAEDVPVDLLRLSDASSFSWTITNTAGHTAFSSEDYVIADTCHMSLRPETPYHFNLLVDSILIPDTFHLELRVNGAAVILINTDIGLGEFSYQFYTGVKEPELRIVGGSDASIEDFPWQVYMQAGNYACGGTIISKRWILTAAHCTQNSNKEPIPASQISIRAGSSSKYSGKEYQVKNYYIHENYNSTLVRNDIAVLELEEDINVSNGKAISLLSSDDVKAGATAPGVMSTVTGWGRVSVNPDSLTSTLQKVQLPLVDYNTVYPVWGPQPMTILFAGYVNGSKDACNGDSGGPLIVDVNGEKRVAGIVSWGAEECNTYGGFTRVSSFLEWIEDKTGVVADNMLPRPIGEYEICEGTASSDYYTRIITDAIYEWRLYPEDAGTLTFTNEKATIEWNKDFIGHATIKVSATHGDETTPLAVRDLEVQKKTELLAFSSDTTICQGESISLNIEALGHNLNYSWYKNSQFYKTTNTNKLIFEKVDTLNTGIYHCIVSGSCGDTTTAKVTLNVRKRTFINGVTEDLSITQGEAISLAVTSVGEERLYQWYKEHEKITEGTTNTFTINTAKATDIARYHVEIDGLCGKKAVSDYIYVYIASKNNQKGKARLWPSLANNEFYVAVGNNDTYTITARNINGTSIYSEQRLTNQSRIDISHWQSGIYFITINNKEVNHTFRMIKR